MAQPQQALPDSGSRPGFKKYAFLLLCVLLIGSIGLRIAFSASSPAPGQTPEQAQQAMNGTDLEPQGLVAGEPDLLPPPGQEPAPGTSGPSEGTEPEETSLEKAIPYLTEGSFFALIGFALGYASRKVVKLGLILLALLFVGLQGLSYLEVIQIDWGRAIEVLNNLILNLNENQTVTEVLKDRLPTAGALGAGYLLGFRRG